MSDEQQGGALSSHIQRPSLFGLVANALSCTWAGLLLAVIHEHGVLSASLLPPPLLTIIAGATLCFCLIMVFSSMIMAYGVKAFINVITCVGGILLACYLVTEDAGQLAFSHIPLVTNIGLLLMSFALALLLYRAVLFLTTVGSLLEGLLICGMSGILAALMLLICLALPAMAQAILIAVLPPLSLLVFTFAKASLPVSENLDEVEMSAGWKYGPVQPQLVQFLSFVALGFAMRGGVRYIMVSSLVPLTLSCAIVGVMFYYIHQRCRAEVPDFLLLQLIASIPLAPLLVLIYSGNAMLATIGFSIILLASLFIITLQVFLIADFCREVKGDAPALFGTTYVVSFAGLFCGALLEYLGRSESLYLLVISVILTIALAFASMRYANIGNSKSNIIVETKGNSLEEGRSIEEICDEISDANGLSNRQREVLILLAKGRNAKYISDTLFIAPHTAKTHIYRIYQKLDIHSQQDLIDMIEKQ